MKSPTVSKKSRPATPATAPAHKPWHYNSDLIFSREQLPEKVVGFVYRITRLDTGKVYIGKKSLEHKTKKKATLKEKAAALALNPKSRIKVVRGVKDSDWLTYWGSCLELKQDLKRLGENYFKREILELCCNKKYLNYCEVEQMFAHQVLRRDSYNGNVAGKFYRRDLLNCPDEPS